METKYTPTEEDEADKGYYDDDEEGALSEEEKWDGEAEEWK